MAPSIDVDRFDRWRLNCACTKLTWMRCVLHCSGQREQIVGGALLVANTLMFVLRESARECAVAGLRRQLSVRLGSSAAVCCQLRQRDCRDLPGSAAWIGAWNPSCGVSERDQASPFRGPTSKDVPWNISKVPRPTLSNAYAHDAHHVWPIQSEHVTS